jgi:N-acetylneuraminic acid mutarotase
MRIIPLILLTLLPFSGAQAQVSYSSGVRVGTNVSFSGARRSASSVIGLVDGSYNQTFSDPANVLEAMRFVDSSFQQQAPITNGTADGCSVIYNGKIYVVGGYGANANTALNYVQIYNPITDSWSQGATIPTAEWGAACSLYNGGIYVFSGVSSGSETPTTNAYLYSIAGNSWSSLTAVPTGIPDGMTGVTVGSFIYLMYESHFWKFDPSASGGLGSYTALTAPPSAAQVQWPATGYVNVSGDDRIYYIGGSTSGGAGYGNGNYYYSITNSTWSSAQAAAPYSSHGQLQQAVSAGVIYYVEGYDGSIFYPSLYAYTAATNSWSSQLAITSQWRDGVMGGFVGTTLYVIGGRNATAASLQSFGMTANESFQIGSSPVLQPFTKIQLNCSGSVSGNVRLGIYADSAGAPGSLITDAGSAAVVNGWTVIPGLSFSGSLGTNYWLVFLLSATDPVSYTAGAPTGSSGGTHCSVSTTFGALPGTFPGGASCQTGSMYAEKLTFK